MQSECVNREVGKGRCVRKCVGRWGVMWGCVACVCVCVCVCVRVCVCGRGCGCEVGSVWPCVDSSV